MSGKACDCGSPPRKPPAELAIAHLSGPSRVVHRQALAADQPGRSVLIGIVDRSVVGGQPVVAGPAEDHRHRPWPTGDPRQDDLRLRVGVHERSPEQFHVAVSSVAVQVVVDQTCIAAKADTMRVVGAEPGKCPLGSGRRARTLPGSTIGRCFPTPTTHRHRRAELRHRPKPSL